jgi:hypothetical protein
MIFVAILNLSEVGLHVIFLSQIFPFNLIIYIFLVMIS